MQRHWAKQGVGKLWAAGVMLAGMLAFTGALADAGPATPPPVATTEGPDEEALANGKDVFANVARCLECHGWDGAGTGKDPRSEGLPPDLRVMELDTEQLTETIRCGRPGTAMPYHDRRAYRESNPDLCYGLTMSDFEGGRKPNRGLTIREDDLQDLVAYIEAKIRGAGPTTLEDCADFFGTPEHASCRGLK